MFNNSDEEFVARIQEYVYESLAGRLTINFAGAAQILGMDEKTLRRHAKSGSITYLDLGHGTERRRRRFTGEDLTTFLGGRRRRDLVPSPRPARRRPTTRVDDEECFMDFVARLRRERR